jgi:protein TonB
MLGTLIESQAHAQRHGMGSLASILAHAALIAAAAIATATRHTTMFDPRPVETIRFPAPVPRPLEAEDRGPAHVAAADASAPRMPTIAVPTIIPTEIPPIDLSAPPTPEDFSESRSHGVGVACTNPCPQLGGAGGDSSTTPMWAASDLLMQLREPPVPPRYPEALRRAGIDGTVVVKFVVDTLGRVDPASIEVLNSSHDLFTAAVRETLARLRFNPARTGDRKVRAAAIMPFQFTLK